MHPHCFARVKQVPRSFESTKRSEESAPALWNGVTTNFEVCTSRHGTSMVKLLGGAKILSRSRPGAEDAGDRRAGPWEQSEGQLSAPEWPGRAHKAKA